MFRHTCMLLSNTCPVCHLPIPPSACTCFQPPSSFVFSGGFTPVPSILTAHPPHGNQWDIFKNCQIMSFPFSEPSWGLPSLGIKPKLLPKACRPSAICPACKTSSHLMPLSRWIPAPRYPLTSLRHTQTQVRTFVLITCYLESLP